MLLVAVPTSWLGVALAWALAHPSSPQPSSAVRVLATTLGASVLGLAVLAWAGRGDRRQPVSPTDLWRFVAALAGGWTAAEAVHVAMTAAEVRGASVASLSWADLTRYTHEVAAGRVDLATLALTAVVTVVAAVAYRRGASWSVVPVAAIAAITLVARPVSGHMAQQVLGSLLDAAHVLAAALWFGCLAAMALALDSRGAWALWLPRYSRLALWCVGVLAVTGVVDALVRLGDVSALVTTGYGRIALAKVVALAVLLLLAWWWRRTWVPAASAHRGAADASLTRAIGEVVLMAVAFGLAAALATTG
nr:CopD family protein [Rhodococcus sp. HNM0569]